MLAWLLGSPPAPPSHTANSSDMELDHENCCWVYIDGKIFWAKTGEGEGPHLDVLKAAGRAGNTYHDWEDFLRGDEYFGYEPFCSPALAARSARIWGGSIKDRNVRFRSGLNSTKWGNEAASAACLGMSYKIAKGDGEADQQPSLEMKRLRQLYIKESDENRRMPEDAKKLVIPALKDPSCWVRLPDIKERGVQCDDLWWGGRFKGPFECHLPLPESLAGKVKSSCDACKEWVFMCNCYDRNTQDSDQIKQRKQDIELAKHHCGYYKKQD